VSTVLNQNGVCGKGFLALSNVDFCEQGRVLAAVAAHSRQRPCAARTDCSTPHPPYVFDLLHMHTGAADAG
jgi:hypothetical protein